MTLLTVQNVSKHYNDKKAVDQVSFTLREHTCVALLGPNGAGKTTILRCLAQLLHPTSGTISYKGDQPSNDRRPFIGYLPQYPSFYGWMTGYEYLVYSGKLAKMEKSEVIDRANELFELVGLTEAKNKKIRTYSGGMKQRLGIAQAIIHQPNILMLDEPVSSLDPIGRREVLQLMEKLKKEMTIIFSTHILSDADEISDELLLLHEGKVIESGNLVDLRKKYQTEVIEIEFKGDLLMYKSAIEQLSMVSHISVVRGILHITVNSIESARQAIFTLALENSWPLTSFSVNRASLEDMFMKAVNNECNG